MYSNRVLEIWLEKWGDRYPLDQKLRRAFLIKKSLDKLCQYEEWVIKKVIKNNQKLDEALSEALSEAHYKKKGKRFRKSDDCYDENGNWIEINQNDEYSRRQSNGEAEDDSSEGSPEGFGFHDGESDWHDYAYQDPSKEDLQIWRRRMSS